MTPAELLRHDITGKAVQPLWAHIACVVLLAGFATAIIACWFAETVPARVALIFAAIIDFTILAVLGGGTTRCRACEGPVSWFSLELKRDDALAMVVQARRRGAQVRLPYAMGGRPCARFMVSGHACERCSLLHIGVIQDPDAPTGD